MGEREALTEVRIDKWLWAARLFKSRTAATEACSAGHVRLAGRTVKPSHPVRVGERLTCLTPGGERIVEVAGLADKRGPAAVAQALYRDFTQPRPAREELPRFEIRERGLGRPTKRDRRRMERWREGG